MLTWSVIARALVQRPGQAARILPCALLVFAFLGSLAGLPRFGLGTLVVQGLRFLPAQFDMPLRLLADKSVAILELHVPNRFPPPQPAGLVVETELPEEVWNVVVQKFFQALIK